MSIKVEKIAPTSSIIEAKKASLFHTEPADNTGLLTISFNEEVLAEIDLPPEEAQEIIDYIEEVKKKLRKERPSLFGD